MTTEKIIALAKEKLGKDITEQEAQDYLDGKITLPDEALAIVSGGGFCDPIYCPNCKATSIYASDFYVCFCKNCGCKFYY